MKIRPLHDQVIVKRKDAESKTTHGIIIPDTAREKPQEGTVMAAGSGIRKKDGTLLSLDIKKGDLILFSKYAGTELRIEGEEYLMMKEGDIFGVIESS